MIERIKCLSTQAESPGQASWGQSKLDHAVTNWYLRKKLGRKNGKPAGDLL
jgi:hypothetical protein